MNGILWRALTFLVIYALVWVYKITLIDQNQLERLYYYKALNLIYVFLGGKHQLIPAETTHNSQVCFDSDIFKLSHPDVIQEDVYCLRLRNDSVLTTYNAKCFSAANQVGSALEMAMKSLSIFHYYPPQAGRRNFIQTRCVFQTNIALQVGVMAAKSYAQEGLSLYQTKLKAQNASQACLRDMDFYPKSFSLDDEKQCQKAFEILHQKYLSNNGTQEYILKSNVHLGQGLTLMTPQVYKKLDVVFQSGSKCGAANKGNKTILQELMNNPVLLNGRKLDFRIWFFVVQTDPLIMYIYNYTGIMTCFDLYDQNDLTQFNFNCNSGVARDYWFKNGTGAKDPLTIEEIHQTWTYAEWGQFLKSLGLVHSDDWWSKEFLPQIETLITYYFKILLKNPLSDQRLSGLYAFDATINRDLQVKLYDFNTGPNYLAITPGNIKCQAMLHENTFQLLQLYMQQRYSGLKNFMQTHMIPRIKNNETIANQDIAQALKAKPLPQKEMFQWFLVDQIEAVRNCKQYDPSL